MARLFSVSHEQRRSAALLSFSALLLLAPLLAVLGCADEALTTDYAPEDTPGAAGALYRPLRPATTPGVAGAGGLTPGLNAGGASSYLPGAAGAGGAPRLGAAGTSSTDTYYGTSGTGGTYGY